MQRFILIALAVVVMSILFSTVLIGFFRRISGKGPKR
jgi:hypothetical protein